ncbi:hypothetical protein ME7_01480 [Bartonella birtlesii LL-WM9]|uniref:Uncharacterized protein n=1 Tax=Bartonella birtlesii LL-WM9 TaxID=1094552 RepID=J1IS21_9HYPH|nr:hypothetical protein ME7_01480 [Bartonella birtlesii LL-WM9]
MVNVFRNHIFLCTFTTAIFYFLPISYVHAAGTSGDLGKAFYSANDSRVRTFADRVYYLKIFSIRLFVWRLLQLCI